MKRNIKILKSYWFLLSLVILLLNDFVLKVHFGNWITGKLSDFAGLFVFSLFWVALFPKHKIKIFAFTSLLFVFWKSSYSQSLIDNWNYYGFLQISRIVDYSDLFALTVLPIAFYLSNHQDKIPTINVNPFFPLSLSLFSFIATSYSTDIELKLEYSFKFPKDTLEKRLFYLPSIENQIREDLIRNSEKLTNRNPIKEFIRDTMTVFVHEDFCFDGYEATIVLSGNNIESKLNLLKIHHVCPRDGKHIIPIKRQDDIKILTRSFKEKVIKKLKNAP